MINSCAGPCCYAFSGTAPPPKTPISAYGRLFFLSVCAILCSVAVVNRKERCRDKVL